MIISRITTNYEIVIFFINLYYYLFKLNPMLTLWRKLKIRFFNKIKMLKFEALSSIYTIHEAFINNSHLLFEHFLTFMFQDLKYLLNRAKTMS